MGKKFGFVLCGIVTTATVFIITLYGMYSKSSGADSVISSNGAAPVLKNKKLDTTIQQSIDQAAESGGGDVYVPAGQYAIAQTIIVKKAVRLQLSSGATLVPTRNINVVELKRGSAIEGGIINTYALGNFTKAAIYLDGAEEFSGTLNAASISDMKLLGRTGWGQGIFFYAARNKDHVSWVQVHDINIGGFDKAIHLKTEPVKGKQTVWINGNNFSQILIKNATYGLYLDGYYNLPYEISGNLFSDVQIQTDEHTKSAIYVKGAKNMITAFIWDYHHGAKAIELDKDSYRNQIYSNVPSSDKALYDRGKDNLTVSAP